LKNESFDFIEDVSLRIPKFKVKSKFDASEALTGLGAEEVFAACAELDKIADGGPLGVGKIIHEAVVEISKEGTEGAAATGNELVLLAGSFGGFGVQKNIVFIVQDRVKNIPVLVGRVKNPSDP
jgi:serine protease inhibitor